MTSFALANRADQRFEGSLSTEAIHAIIWGHISQARDSWTQRKPRVHEEERDRFETVAEASTRAQIDQVKRYKSVRKANRKRTVSIALCMLHLSNTCRQKLNKREDGVKKLITHSSKPEEKKKWKRVGAVLGDLGELGQSSDDTDVEVEGSALVTTEPYGRRRFLSRVLADLDASINELQLKIAAQHGKKHLAHPLQIRRRTGRKTQPKAIIGLPRSLYHHRFLARLSPASVERLEINDKCLPHLADFENWALAEQANSDSEAEARDDSPLILH